MVKTIGNPMSWTGDALGSLGAHLSHATERVRSAETSEMPEVHRLEMADLSYALRAGLEDFKAMRSDVMFVCLLYPVIGTLLIWAAFDAALLPLLFPLAAGFALVGPAAALGLYAMSRKREAHGHATWGDAINVIRSPALGPILVLSGYLMAIYTAWTLVAWQLHAMTMGAGSPDTARAFLVEVLTSPQGYTMMAIGIPTGFLFALLVLVVSLVSFPMLLDRDVGLPVAVMTSLRVARRNPVVVCAWGLIVASLLFLGSLPFFLGLIVVMPILGHATWHLYRRAVDKPHVGWVQRT